MSKKLLGSVFGAALYAAAGLGSASAQDAPAPAAPPANVPPASSGSVQSAPNTTVVQPAPAAPTVVQPAPGGQTPVVVEKEKEPDSNQTVVQQTNVDADESEAPSVFSRAAQGLFAGAAVGAAGGYLVGRRDDWERSDWRAVGLGIGVGALAGTGVGMMFGFMDQGGVRAGRYIPRDMLAGAGLGALVGVIGGGIAAGATDDPEKVAFGASVGVLAGAGLGIITGIVEGKMQSNQDVRARAVASRRVRLAPDLVLTRAAGGNSVVMPGMTGRF